VHAEVFAMPDEVTKKTAA